MQEMKPLRGERKLSRSFPQQKNSLFWTMVFWWVSACLSTIMVFFVTRCTFTDLIWGTEAHCWNLKCPQVFDKMWFEWQRSFIHAAQLWSRKWSGRQQNTSAWIRHTFCFHFLNLHPLSSFLQKAKIQEISERNVNVFINDRNQFRHLSRETEGIKMDYNRSASSDEVRALRFVTSPSAASSVWFGAKSRAEVSSLHSFSLHILKVTEEKLSFLHRLQEFGSICLKFFCQLNPPQKYHAARGDDFSPLDFTCPTTEFKVFILSSVERSVAVSRVSLLGLINSLWRLNISTSAVTSMWRLKINHWDSGGRTWLHLFVDYCDSWLVSWLIQGQWLESGN